MNQDPAQEQAVRISSDTLNDQQLQVSPTSAASHIHCSVCQQVFTRTEHLTRHAKSHEAERSLQCSTCSKGFYRLDALRRHEKTHREATRSRLGKGGRACFACAAARGKCSGGDVCQSCEKRSIQCIYPDRVSHHTLKDCNTSSASPQASLTSWSDASPSPATTGIPTFAEKTPGGEWRQTGKPGGVDPLNHHEYSSDPISGSRPDPYPTSDTRTQISSTTRQTHVMGRKAAADVRIPSSMSTMNWLYDSYSSGFPNDLGTVFSAETPPFPWNQQHFAQAGGHPSNISSILNPIIPEASATPRFLLTEHNNLHASPDNVESQLQSRFGDSTHGLHDNRAATGQYYVDGDGARLPHIKRRRTDASQHSLSLSSESPNFLSESQLDHVFRFPTIDVSFDSSNSSFKLVPGSCYNEMLMCFEKNCISSSTFPNYSTGTFPTIRTITRLVELYFEQFQPILPFIHAPTFNIQTSHWLLTLAIAAIGSHYIAVEDQDFVASLHELVRRAILTTTESLVDIELGILLLTQIKFLNFLGMQYCGDGRFSKFLRVYQPDLLSFCETYWTSGENDSVPSANAQACPVDSDWTYWHEVESLRRTGFCIWLVDCMSAFHFQMRPLLSLGATKVPLPCQEVLWEAESLMDWRQLFSCAAPSPTLQVALQSLYIEKRLQPSTGEFSRKILIHALFQRTWEVETYFRQPLSYWTPAANIQESNPFPGDIAVWLPGNPTYSKWRNSACDCLDILHWHANSVIGATAGFEHPTVLHLHLARIVLLTPFRDIIYLANSISNGKETKNQREEADTKKNVQRWATEDQYKARLAMVHAGALFWHVRRYSADAFYEPWSAWLATLSLWAYSTFTKHTVDVSPAEESSPNSDEHGLFQTSIQLDRPVDDELVQQFVKSGTLMRANITGVGNLHSSKGPERVLTEGRKLLVGLKHWDGGRTRIAFLTRLAQTYESRS